MRDIASAFLKTTSATVATLILNSVSIKILAIYLGPAGIGLFSLLRQIENSALIIATLSGQTALVQGASAREGNEQLRFLRTTLTIFLISAVAVVIVLLIGARLVAEQVLLREDASSVWLVRMVALPLVLTVLSGYAYGVLNVQREIGKMSIARTVGALAAVAIALPSALLVQQGHEWALLLVLLVNQIVILSLTGVFLWRTDLGRQIADSFRLQIDRPSARVFLRFSSITAVAGLLASSVMLIVRAMITRGDGLAAAGIFDASWTLSMTYITLVTTSFGTYYLPTLSSQRDAAGRKALIGQMFRFTLLVTVPSVLAMIILKPLVLTLLFSNEFLPGLLVSRWMLLGDYFKLTGWVFAYLMLASADLRIYFWSEVAWHTFFLAGSTLSILYFGTLEGVGITFLLLYCVYFVFVVAYAWVRHGFSPSRAMVTNWLVGLAIVVIASAVTWNDESVRLPILVVGILVALLYGWFLVSAAERDALFKAVGRAVRLTSP